MSESRESAFTLVEVVVSAVVLAAVMAVVAGLVGGVLGGAGRIEAAVERDCGLAEIDDLIADDLAFIAAVTPAGDFQLSKRPDGTSFFAFYSAAGARAAWGDVVTPVHRVTYTVEPTANATLRSGPLRSTSGGKGLFRGEEPIVRYRNAYYDKPLLVSGGVTGFVVEAYDGSQWHDVWPDEGAAGMPVLVSVTMEVTGDDGVARTVFVESAPSVEVVLRPSRTQGASKPSASGRPATPADGEPSGDESAEGSEVSP